MQGKKPGCSEEVVYTFAVKLYTLSWQVVASFLPPTYLPILSLIPFSAASLSAAVTGGYL
jgi:hypothetical protein